MAIREDTHCVFNVNSYQMVFVANSESFLYKRHAFTRAKQVRVIALFFDCELFFLMFVLFWFFFSVPQSGDVKHAEAFLILAAAMGRGERDAGCGKELRQLALG